MVEQIEEIYSNKEEKSLYINNIEKIDLVDIVKYVKKTNRKKMDFKNMCSTCI